MENKPCTGCGFCCRKAQCVLSVHKYGVQPVCPALVKVGNRYICKLAELYREALAIGAGCCSPLNSDRRSMQ